LHQNFLHQNLLAIEISCLLSPYFFPVFWNGSMRLRIGTRRSALAQTQTRHVISLIKAQNPDVECVVKFITSVADKDRKSEFHQFGISGVFTTEHEQSLQRNEVDIVVHSLKDLPTTLLEGLVLACVPTREEPRDALCGSTLDDLRQGAKVGTASLRRRAQMLALRKDIDVVPIRGNLQPRLNRTKGTDRLDAVILAAAGLSRLELGAEISQMLDAMTFPYAVAQGALGIETRGDDAEIIALLQKCQCPKARAEVDAERAMMHALGAGCSLPIGVVTSWSGGAMRLHAQITALNGEQSMIAAHEGIAAEAEALGIRVADDLKKQGGVALLQETYRNHCPHFKLTIQG
jgi:hydroxymethylbilane synthase